MSTTASLQSLNGDDNDASSDPDDRIRRTRLEIAALRHPKVPVDRFEAAKSELAEVVEATEAASSVIFGHVEQAEEIANTLLGDTQDAAARAKLQAIIDTITQVYEALSFQDLTGQRMNKVRQTIEYVEHRVSALTEIWGPEEIENLPLPDETPEEDDAHLLNGPRGSNEAGVNQADIDALFD